MVGSVNSNSCEKKLGKIKSIGENNNSKNTLKFKLLHTRESIITASIGTWIVTAKTVKYRYFKFFQYPKNLKWQQITQLHEPCWL